VQTSLRGMVKKAQEQKKHRCGNLYEMLNEENLHDCWRYIKKDAAYGVDRVSAREYEENLEENIITLGSILTLCGTLSPLSCLKLPHG